MKCRSQGRHFLLKYPFIAFQYVSKGLNYCKDIFAKYVIGVSVLVNLNLNLNPIFTATVASKNIDNVHVVRLVFILYKE